MMTWEDQPEILSPSDIVLHFCKSAKVYELRRSRHARYEYFLTVGNLFGSQTAGFDTLPQAIKALNGILNHEPKGGFTKEQLERDYQAHIIENTVRRVKA